MTRVLMFIVAATLIVGVVGLGSYMKIPVNNDRFSYENQKEKYENKEALHAELAAKLIAEPEEEVEEEVVEEGPIVVLDTPQLEKGHALYQKCISCHGKKGEGKKAQKAPRLGGQLAWYITSSLKAMKDGTRPNKVMNPYLKKLEEQDFIDLGVYLAKMPWN